MFDPESLPPLRDVIARHDLRAEKKLGQNFILDSNVTSKIARAGGDLSDLTVFEIGPGPGGLTRSILAADAHKVIAIEFDPRAVTALAALSDAADGRLQVVHDDALRADLVQLAPDVQRALIANLPYNIATPLLLRWLGQIRQDMNSFSFMMLMFQKEVAMRLVAQPGTKEYGRLSIMAQWLCNVHRVFDLPPSVFVPPPKVTSSVVHFVPRVLPADAPPVAVVERITAAAFGQRRKMIRSSLKDYRAVLEKLGINETLRAEQLSVDDFINIAKAAG